MDGDPEGYVLSLPSNRWEWFNLRSVGKEVLGRFLQENFELIDESAFCKEFYEHCYEKTEYKYPVGSLVTHAPIIAGRAGCPILAKVTKWDLSFSATLTKSEAQYLSSASRSKQKLSQ